MQQPCSYCDQPNASLLRLVLIGEILCADESLLVLFADVMQRSGLLQLSEEPKAPQVQPQSKSHTPCYPYEKG